MVFNNEQIQRRNKLIPENIDEIDESLKRTVNRDGEKTEVLKEWRWKGEWIPLEYVNIMVGPHVRSMAGFMSRQYVEKIRDQSWKSYFATEIPACSVMGENMYVSGVSTGY